MSRKTAAVDLSDRPVYGAPRLLPVVLLCHATVEWCGKLWICNTQTQFKQAETDRQTHEKTCEAVQALRALPGEAGRNMSKLIF